MISKPRSGRAGFRKNRNITSLLRRLLHQPLVQTLVEIVILVLREGLAHVMQRGLA
jgi:hypothetical protein